jgi:hypothetical protein
MKKHHIYRSKLILTIMLASLVAPGLLNFSRNDLSLANSFSWSDEVNLFRASEHASVLYQSDGAIRARNATAEETLLIADRDAAGPLQTISSYAPTAQTGLRIMLRATSQLESNPQAKAAFIRAASLWESLVRTPMTIILDIDYGPTCFGAQVESDVIGFTNPQLLIGDPIYLRFLSKLLDNASTEHELGLYYSMPQPTLPTDQGETSAIISPSPVFRALGLIDRYADAAPDPPFFGPPPAIWLNSTLPYDFDYSDGIDEDKYDFDAVLSRELGRVLGFYSAVGRLEVDPDAVLAASAWDVFRLPPNTSIESFSMMARILESGGNHFFFMGDDDLPLSTGRPDSSGGDGRAASHWKDDLILGTRIGIMDPTIPLGKRQTVTLNDVEALDLFGYALRVIGNAKPAINSLAADLNGDVLTLSGSLTDADGDVVQAQLTFLDGKDRVVGQSAPFPADFGILPAQLFSFDFPGMSSLPAVEQVALTVIDTKGNASAALKAGFTAGDAGGPRIKSAGFKEDKLIIKGKGLKPGVQIEINGVIIDPPSGIDAAKNGKTVEIEGTTQELNIRLGPNRIRAIRNGLRSNVFIEEVE